MNLRGTHGRRAPSSKLVLPIMAIAFTAIILQTMWVSKNRSRFVNPGVMNIFRGVMKAEVLPIRCYFCDGAGVLEDAGKESTPTMCPVCFGLGHNDVRIVNDNEMVCHACYGMGRRLDADTVSDCDVCDGRGLLKTPRPKIVSDKNIELFSVECESCSGQGYVRPYGSRMKALCPVCFGIGWHTARKMNKGDGVCPACGGMGRISDDERKTSRTCDRCGGRGLILPHADLTRAAP